VVSTTEPRTAVGKYKGEPPTEYLKDGRVRRWCHGRKKDGTQCLKAPIEGGTVCSKHGGRAPHIKNAARARIENAADRLARQLLGIAMDENAKPEIRLAAIRDALDRAGLSARQAVDVSMELKPYEKLFDRLDRSAGGVDTSVSAPMVVDGEVVGEWAEFDYGSTP
jgi:hypothetical protein